MITSNTKLVDKSGEHSIQYYIT